MLNLNTKSISTILLAVATIFAGSSAFASELNTEELTSELVNSAVAATSIEINESLFESSDVKLVVMNTNALIQNDAAE